MLELSADDDVFSFTHAGEVYVMPQITIDDIEALAEALTLGHAEMARTTRDYLLELTRDDYPATADLIGRVGLKNYFLIFRAWSGMTTGESQPSDGS